VTNGQIIWTRHTWDFNDAEIDLSAPEGYYFNSASPHEEQLIIDVVLSAYASDPVWQPIMTSIRERMIGRISTTLGAENSDYLVARSGPEIVAASGVAKEHWTGQNLLTGVCVLPEHQRKGIGRYLLGLSLIRLKQMGLRRAQVYTESGSMADAKIYRLFGSRREEGVRYPGVNGTDCA
jgi:ribosomal protein S18 acetylase RimI-like enzyme